MSTTTNDLGIIVGVDESSFSNDAVRWAAREAAMHRTPMTILHAISPAITDTHDPLLLSRITRWQTSHGHRIVDDARNIVAEVAGRDIPEVTVEVVFSPAVPALTNGSKSARMVVVGSRGGSRRHRIHLGSVSAGLCHHAHCPVAVVHGDGGSDADDKPVLLGIDGSPASEAATAIAFDEASRRGVGVLALHAWSDVGAYTMLGPDWQTFRDDGEEVLAERLAGWQEHYPDVPVERRLVCDAPAHWLIEEAANAQLVVVGSRGRGGFAGMLLGSVSTAVAESVAVPVIVARQP